MLKESQCHWHIGQIGDVSDSAYCGKKVNYITVKDDDNNPQRKYSDFCPKHLTLAKRQEEEEDD